MISNRQLADFAGSISSSKYIEKEAIESRYYISYIFFLQSRSQMVSLEVTLIRQA